MKLVLHIGTEKTGTTTIQKYLHQNSKALEAKGIFYAKCLGRPNNIDIAVYGMDLKPTQPFFLHRDIHDEAGHAQFKRRVEAELQAEVEAAREAGCHTYVISNEHCHSRLLKQEEVARVHGLLSRLFDRIDVICYLRPQVDLAISLASTSARQERVDATFFTRIGKGSLYYDFNALLERWANCFGEAAIVPVAFKGLSNPAADFARRIGVAEWQSIANQRSNSALDVNTIALLNAIEVGPHILPGRLTRHPVPFLDMMPVIETIRLPRDMAQALQANFASSNRQLFDHWPSIRPEDLEPDWGRFDEKGNLEKLHLTEPIPIYLKAMVDRLVMQNWVNEAQMQLAFSERAEARGNRQNASVFVATARNLTDLVRQSFPETPILLRVEADIAKVETRLAAFAQKANNN
ncbi:hypothetical protein [Rhizobium alvei]|uniref:Sulfotransferase family protein n=1 Tax=Rhizobium alvei TaxID=1132659 RepID=A0ABT8YK20_9HYPH|nr:hypothetical protein [Rhizobium alvei]MDO6963698.1 hypothetical protein [Rhizobium alvei]